MYFLNSKLQTSIKHLLYVRHILCDSFLEYIRHSPKNMGKGNVQTKKIMSEETVFDICTISYNTINGGAFLVAQR